MFSCLAKQRELGFWSGSLWISGERTPVSRFWCISFALKVSGAHVGYLKRMSFAPQRDHFSWAPRGMSLPDRSARYCKKHIMPQTSHLIWSHPLQTCHTHPHSWVAQLQTTHDLPWLVVRLCLVWWVRSEFQTLELSCFKHISSFCFLLGWFISEKGTAVRQYSEAWWLVDCTLTNYWMHRDASIPQDSFFLIDFPPTATITTPAPKPVALTSILAAPKPIAHNKCTFWDSYAEMDLDKSSQARIQMSKDRGFAIAWRSAQMSSEGLIGAKLLIQGTLQNTNGPQQNANVYHSRNFITELQWFVHGM